jgi:iron transport multicopper oxidase
MAGRWVDALLRTTIISSALLCVVRADTYDLSVSWLRRNPDGLAERSVIGVNGQWPIPVLNFTVGENVIVNLHNQVRREMRKIVSINMLMKLSAR